MRHLIPAVVVLAAVVAHAQTDTPPATQDTKRYELVMPDGFQLVTVGDRKALCESGDVEWVKKALAAVKPSTRPSTLPADLVTKATASRETIVKGLTADLGLTDSAPIAEFVDNKLLATLKKIDALRPPVFHVVTTREKLKLLVKSGWGTPRYRYSPAIDAVSYPDPVISIHRAMDDSPVPAYFKDGTTEAAKVEAVVETVREMEESIAKVIATNAQIELYKTLAQHLGTTYFEPMKLKRDQNWFAQGVVAVLGCKYAAVINGSPREFWVKSLIAPPRGFPIPPRILDLINPREDSAMTKEAVPLYAQAIRMRGIQVVSDWADKAGDGAIPKVVTAMRQSPPADGKALLQLIKDKSGVDLTKEVAPQETK